jgi:hypothetical protein
MNDYRDDDNEDLSTLDRGDDIGVDTQPRDEQGRFASKEESEAQDEDEDADTEGDDEDEAEDTETEDEEDEEDETPRAKNVEIRVKKALQQRDAERQRVAELEERLKLLEQQSKPQEQPPQGKTEFDQLNERLEALYEQAEDARADGNTKEAARLQREIDAANRRIVTLEAGYIAAQTTTRASEDARFDAMVDVIEAKFPELKKGHDEYDVERVRELNFDITAYEKAGMSPTQALHRAVTRMFGEDPFAPQAPKPEVKEKPAPKKPNVEKAVNVQKKTPPDASERGVNRDDSNIRVDELSEDEFEALPESKKRQLRGDFA